MLRHAWPLILFALASLLPLAARAQPWQKVRHDAGITSWKRELAGEPLPAYRAEVTLDATVWQALAVLDDVDLACEWTSHCAEMRRLRTLSAREILVYARMDAPWPVRDRDVAVRVSIETGGADELSVVIQDEAAVEPRAGAVRMAKFRAHYRFRTVAGDQVEVQYELQFDPGGALPDWLKALVAKNVAHDTLDDLRERVQWARAGGVYTARAAGLQRAARAAGYQSTVPLRVAAEP